MTPVLAGGGRFYLIALDDPGIANVDGIEIKAQLTKFVDGYSTAPIEPSVGENAIITTDASSPGNRCEMRSSTTDSQGYLYATCYASTPGTYEVYIHSNDHGDNSNKILLTFDEKHDSPSSSGSTPTPTPEPTKIISGGSTQKAASQATIVSPTTTPRQTSKPTPTPVVEVQGFFSNPGNWVGITFAVVILSGLVYLLAKHKLIDLSKFKKTEPQETETQTHPEQPPTS